MTDGSTRGAQVADGPDATTASLWEDFVDVFTNPSSVFERRRDGRYAAGITMFATLSAVAFVATRPFWQPFFDRQFDLALAAQRASGKLTPDQLEQGRAFAQRFGEIGVWFAGIAGPAIAVMVVAVLVLVAGRVVSARLTYGQALVVATMAYVPRILANVVSAGVLAVKDVATLGVGVVPTSPAALLGPDASPVVTSLLGRFDPFVLWSTVLIGIGVSVIARVPRSKGFSAAGLVWMIATLGGLLNAARTVAAGS